MKVSAKIPQKSLYLLVGGAVILAIGIVIVVLAQPKTHSATIFTQSTSLKDPNPPATNSATSHTIAPAEASTTTSSTTSDPCTKTIVNDSTKNGQDVSNDVSTDVQCSINESGDNTSIRIDNNSSQTATSGSSTGKTGNASASDQTKVDVKVNH